MQVPTYATYRSLIRNTNECIDSMYLCMYVSVHEYNISHTYTDIKHY